MEDTKRKIMIAIDRANAAYKLYIDEKKYLQAKRVYKSNKVLYNLLQDCMYDKCITDYESYFSFLFHLEDWFEQFKAHELELEKTLNLNSVFIFDRYKNSPEFPKNFLNTIK